MQNRFWMVLLGAAATLGLAIAGGVALWDDPAHEDRRDPLGRSQDAMEDAASGSSEPRIAALERALRDERSARGALETRLGELAVRVALLDARSAADPSIPAEGASQAELGPPSEAEMDAVLRGFAERFTADRSEDRRVNRLVSGGFDVAFAEQIVQRESELQMEDLQRRYEASQNGEPITGDLLRSPQATLREELGDDQYERYRDAMGHPTSVRVDHVLANSPAQAVGLQAGDQVIRYDGERIFDMADLNRLTLEGSAGQSVSMDILRDGDEMRISIPRGPIGVQVSGARAASASRR